MYTKGQQQLDKEEQHVQNDINKYHTEANKPPPVSRGPIPTPTPVPESAPAPLPGSNQSQLGEEPSTFSPQ